MNFVYTWVASESKNSFNLTHINFLDTSSLLRFPEYLMKKYGRLYKCSLHVGDTFFYNVDFNPKFTIIIPK